MVLLANRPETAQDLRHESKRHERKGPSLTHLLGSQLLSNKQRTKAAALAAVAAQQRDEKEISVHCWKVVHDEGLDQVAETFGCSLGHRTQVLLNVFHFSFISLDQGRGEPIHWVWVLRRRIT